MPTDYSDEESLEKYVNACANINATFVDHDSSNLMVIGDFNSQPSSRFYSTLNHLVSDNKLIMTDINLLDNVFTYCSDSGASTSWIDHVVISQAVHNFVKYINVKYDYTCSDHRPLTVTLSCIPSMSNNAIVTSATSCSYVASDWANADPSVISLYRHNLDYNVTDVVVPSCLINCYRNVMIQVMQLLLMDNIIVL
jgi:hypothetical protein